MKVYQGDVLAILPTLPENSVDLCLTSPPYWGLRMYLPEDSPLKHLEIGQEKSPEEYVAKMVQVFREVRRVLKPTGVLMLNIGDSASNHGKWGVSTSGKHVTAIHGKRGKVIVPATNTDSWNGSKFNDGRNELIHPNVGQKDTVSDREVDGWIYEPTIPLEDHPIVPAVVLDPFGGSFTTAKAAAALGRDAIMIELNPAYIEFGKTNSAQMGFTLA